MGGQQECDLDFEACDRDLAFTTQHARGGHGGVEPACDDPALDDAALRMPFDRVTVTLFGVPFDRDAVQGRIVGDASHAQELPCRWTPRLDLLDQF